MFESQEVARFTNWSDESFSWKWAGEEATFEAGESRVMPIGLAEHFAKHLTNRELTKKGLEMFCSPKSSVEVAKFKEYFDKAFSADVNAKKAETLNEKIEVEEKLIEDAIENPVRRGRPKKVHDEESFEGK